jgi:hypothetical protein
VDDENERVTVSSDEELWEALRVVRAENKTTARFEMELQGDDAFPSASGPGRVELPAELGFLPNFVLQAMSDPALRERASCLFQTLGSLNSQFNAPSAPAYATSECNEASSAKGADAQAPAVHTFVTCDVCGMHPIVGVRYKCTVREDYDMCENCEAKCDHSYALLKVNTPAQAPAAMVTVLHEGQVRTRIRA